MKIAESSAEKLALPQLGDVLVRYQSTAFLDIELKVSGLERSSPICCAGCLHRAGFVISSFLPEVLRAIHELDATIPLGLICETKPS